MTPRQRERFLSLPFTGVRSDYSFLYTFGLRPKANERPGPALVAHGATVILHPSSFGMAGLPGNSYKTAVTSAKRSRIDWRWAAYRQTMLGCVQITLSNLIVETLDKAGVEDFIYPLAVFVRCADGAEVTRVYTEEGAQQTGGHQKMGFPAVVALTDGAGRTWRAALDEKGRSF